VCTSINLSVKTWVLFVLFIFLLYCFVIANYTEKIGIFCTAKKKNECKSFTNRGNTVESFLNIKK